MIIQGPAGVLLCSLLLKLHTAVPKWPCASPACRGELIVVARPRNLAGAPGSAAPAGAGLPGPLCRAPGADRWAWQVYMVWVECVAVALRSDSSTSRCFVVSACHSGGCSSSLGTFQTGSCSAGLRVLHVIVPLACRKGHRGRLPAECGPHPAAPPRQVWFGRDVRSAVAPTIQPALWLHCVLACYSFVAVCS